MMKKMMVHNIIDCYIINCAIPSISLQNRFWQAWLQSLKDLAHKLFVFSLFFFAKKLLGKVETQALTQQPAIIFSVNFETRHHIMKIDVDLTLSHMYWPIVQIRCHCILRPAKLWALICVPLPHLNLQGHEMECLVSSCNYRKITSIPHFSSIFTCEMKPASS